MRKTFAVGRVDRKTTEVRVVERGDAKAPAVSCPSGAFAPAFFTAGPFRLAAVVRATGAVVRLER